MNNIIRHTFLAIILLCLLPLSGSGQDCLIEEIFVINDNNSTTINIQVTGALLNDLSDPNQGLCEIHIAFEHGAVGQLECVVTSPFGQQIQLMGPAGANNNSTQLVSWDISFVQDMIPANPDMGLPPDWNHNFMNWPMFVNYTGSYHPFMGNLEDFNMGTVNGIWTIQFNDVTTTQAGEITSISLVFCDGTGVNCNTCNTADFADVEVEVDSIGCNGDFGSVDFISIENFIDFEWDGPNDFMSTFESPLFLSPGVYYVTATADSGCEHLDTIYMDWENDVTDMVYEDLIFSCGQSEGFFLQSGDFTAWTFDWTGPGTFSSVDPNPVIEDTGEYHLVMTSLDNSCILEIDLSATQGAGATVELEANGVLSCVQDLVNISAMTTSILSSSIWSGPSSMMIIDDFNISIVEEGWYYYTTIDSGGCQKVDSIFIEDISRELDLTIPVSPLVFDCTTNGVNLMANSAEPSINFMWSDEESNIYPGEAPFVTEEGKYYVEIIASDGCSSRDSLEVVADTLSPEVNILVTHGGVIDCQVDSVRLTAFPSHTTTFTFEWTGPLGVLPQTNEVWVKEPGIWTFNIYGDNGCDLSETVEVTSEVEEFEVNVSDVTLDCNQETVDLMAISTEPNLDYEWDGPGIVNEMNETISVNIAGMYFVTATNDADCEVITEATVTLDEDQPVIEILVSDTLDCNVSTINLTAQSDLDILSVSWTGDMFDSDQVMISIDEPGTYELELTATNGCSTTEIIMVPIDTISPILSIQNDTITCTDQVADISVIDDLDNANYAWDGPGLLIDNVHDQMVTNTGLYMVTVTNLDNGCSADIAIEVIDDLAEPTLSLSSDEIPCDGGMVQVLVDTQSDINEYNWTGPGPFMSQDPEPFVSIAGEYVVTAVGLNGCMTIETIMVMQAVDPPVFGLDIGMINCSNPAIVCALDVQDDLSVIWFDEMGIELDIGTCVMIDTPGDYSVIVTGINGCSEEEFFSVSEDNVSINVNILQSSEIICAQQSSMLTAEILNAGAYDFQWSVINGTIIGSDTGQTIEILGTGIYEVSVTDPVSSCTGFADIIVTETPNSIEDVQILVTDPDCFGLENGSLNIENIMGGVAPVLFSLNGSEFSEERQYNNLAPGVYELEIIDAQGCQFILEFVIGFGADVAVEIGDDIMIMLGDSVELNAQVNIDPENVDVLSWSSTYPLTCDTCYEQVLFPTTETIVEIFVQDENGCTDSDQITIGIEEPEIFTANIFSPNGDGNNDEFIPLAGPGIAEILELRIYDRWGGLVHEVAGFEAGDFSASWDGSLNGRQAESGVYVYLIEAVTLRGDPIQKTGSLTLVR